MSREYRVNALAEVILADMLDISSAVLYQYWNDVENGGEGNFVSAVVELTDGNIEIQSFSNGQVVVDIIGRNIGLLFGLMVYDAGLIGLGLIDSKPDEEMLIASNSSIIAVLRGLNIRTNGEVADAMVSSQLQQAIRQK